MIKTSEFKLNGAQVNYEVTDEGYTIYLGQMPWMQQTKPNFPVSELGDTIEECCLKHIADLCKVEEPVPVKDDKYEKLRSDVDYIAFLNDIDLGNGLGEEDTEDTEDVEGGTTDGDEA